MSEMIALDIVLTTNTEGDGNLLPFDPDDFNQYAGTYRVRDNSGTWELTLGARNHRHAAQITAAITGLENKPLRVWCNTTREIKEINPW